MAESAAGFLRTLDLADLQPELARALVRNLRHRRIGYVTYKSGSVLPPCIMSCQAALILYKGCDTRQEYRTWARISIALPRPQIDSEPSCHLSSVLCSSYMISYQSSGATSHSTSGAPSHLVNRAITDSSPQLAIASAEQPYMSQPDFTALLLKAWLPSNVLHRQGVAPYIKP